jgi:glycine cleavage system H protein
MSTVPADLRYAKSHEWVKLEVDGTALVGITDYAQSSLGDITYVQLPKVGATLKAGEVFGVVESVKAASDLYAPVGGTVVAVGVWDALTTGNLRYVITLSASKAVALNDTPQFDIGNITIQQL